jgi:transposase
MASDHKIYQLKVIYNTVPSIWRRIQIPENYTIWDLLVTIHDSLNLLDCRFHQFNIFSLVGNNEQDNTERKDELEILRNWEQKIFEVHQKGKYSIDAFLNYGASKQYSVYVEKKIPPEQDISYPICIDGQNSLHPNQSPQIPGYSELIKSLISSGKVENKKLLQWLGKNFSQKHSGLNSNINSHRKGKNKFSTIYLDKENTSPITCSLWLLKIIQGGFYFDELAHQFVPVLPKKDVVELYDCILRKPLKQRKQALCILSLFKGIPKKDISKYLNIPRLTIYEYIRRYKKGGVNRLLNRKTTAQKKYERPLYSEEIFSILHSPPSTHGFNRTTWKLGDIQKVMASKNLSINKRYISKIINNAGYKVTKARKRLTSNDPNYREKLNKIKNILSKLGNILSKLGPKEKFFSIDEYGPFAIKMYGGRSLAPPGKKKTIPQWQKSKGSLIITAALELSTNQVTHFFSEKKNTIEMIKLLKIIIKKYSDEVCIYFSWDAASWHASKELYKRVDEINSGNYKEKIKSPVVKLAPLPKSAQFLNVIESVFSGMAKAIIHNSNYQSVGECKVAINRYFEERNQHFKKNPKRAGKKIWGKEREKAVFSESNNCKDPLYR